MGTELLKVSHLEAGYGQIRVLRGLSLEVMQGELVAILGANGAGKSTLLRTISGVLHPQAGTIAWQGTSIERSPAHKIAQLGIAHVPEGRGVFPEMTVEENLRVGGFARPKPGEGKRLGMSAADVFRLFPVLKPRLKQVAGTLSGGQQQMLAVGRGLMADPRLLILDEPLLGLAPALAKEVMTVLKEIVGLGLTVLLVEENARAVMAVADRIYVLSTGEIVAQGPPAEVHSKLHLEHAYLGTSSAPEKAQSSSSPAAATVPTSEARALGVENLSASFGGNMALDRVTLHVHENETVGLIGPNGAGKSTLINCVSGYLVPSGGKVEILGKNADAGLSPHKRCQMGVTRTFQNLQLFGTLTVLDNLLPAIQISASRRQREQGQAGKIDKREEAERLLELFDITQYARSTVALLPYGVRKLVELARAVATDAKLLLLDEPTAGLTAEEKERLVGTLRRLREKHQISVLLIEHDMTIVESLGDRIYVLDLGRLIAEGSYAEISRDPEVVRAYLGETVVPFAS